MWLLLVVGSLIGLLSSDPGYAHGTLHTRLDHLNQQIAQEPQNVELYLIRAGLYRHHAEWRAALADIDHAARLAPQRLDIDYFRARVYLDAGQPQNAAALLQRFLNTMPDHVAARVARARALVQLERYAEAAADYTRAITDTSQPIPEYYLERAQALVKAGKEYYEAALRSLDEGLERLGLVVSLVFLAIDLELAQNRVDAALARLDQAAQHTPRQESWLVRRGEMLATAGRTQEAREALQQALVAMATLPKHRQQLPASVELASRARRALARLDPLSPLLKGLP
jgi:tetratricopeptide (TPR) repeat protein